MKIVSVDLERCVGCRNCELACSFYQNGHFRREEANISVNLYPEERFVATFTCVQCEKPLCARICPAGAITREPATQAMVVDESRCLGCKMCVQVCPFGNIQLNRERHVAQKCNACEGEPKCVRFCMAQALQYVDVEDIPGTRRKTLDRRLRNLYPSLSSGVDK
jgi:carbon-monoxide dehydrogenase iron sulfur subunit